MTGQLTHGRRGAGKAVPPRWLRTVRDFPRATSTGRFWCRSDGESHADFRWIGRSAAHVARWRSLKRRGVYDTRWTVLR